jgi:hypothetical protein
MNNSFILTGILFFFSIISAQPSFVDIENGKTELINTQEMRFCWISFVKVNGKKFLVKQKKPLNKLLGVVRDAITAAVAESFGIAHQVDIIPAGMRFPGKKRVDWPATIHTIAPGKMIKGQNSAYNRLAIKQADIGFQPDMMGWMAKHESLIKIVALDTFLCNHDRHRGNLFYNQATKSFCAIDMDSAFKYNLCALGYNYFKHLIESRSFKLKDKHKQVLIAYKEALEFLIAKHKPKSTVALYDHFVEKAGFVPGSDFYSKKFALQIESNKAMIRQSYIDVKKMVKMLTKFLQMAK